MNLDRYRVPQLKNVALSVGSAVSGTKRQLAENVVRQVTELCRPHSRLVSLDLGLKNIGFCRLENLELQELCRLSFDGSSSQPQLAHNVVRFARDILQSNPSTILMERQRSRTMGRAAVPDNIVKMVVFEGMLHTALACISPNTQLVSVDPRAVVAFWRDRLGISDKNRGYRESKKLRLDLVDQWTNEGRFGLQDRVLDGKKDDMCDALVQGVTWVEWKHNAELLNSRSSQSLE